MKSNVFVSVIMPVFNAQNYLRQAIESILDQTHSNFEFIIVDDASSDGSGEIIKRYHKKDSRIKVLRNATNLKITKSLNKGIGHSSGKYIVRMDADDESLLDRIEKQILFMEANPDVGVSGSQANILGTKEAFFKTFYLNDGELRAALLFGTGIIHPTAIIRRSILNDLKAWYNPDFDFADDVELWFRISKISKLANQPDVLLNYRWHDENWTSTYQEKIKLDVARLRTIIYKHFLNYQLTEGDERILEKKDHSTIRELIALYSTILKSYDAKISSNYFSKQLLARVFSNSILLKVGSESKISLVDFFIYILRIYRINPDTVVLKDWIYWGIKRGKFLR